MACGGCRKGGGNRHASDGSSLSQFAFLTPRQLKLREQQEAVKNSPAEDLSEGLPKREEQE